jgi:hypothetical protein
MLTFSVGHTNIAVYIKFWSWYLVSMMLNTIFSVVKIFYKYLKFVVISSFF